MTVIIGGRYGSIDKKSGLSWTEKEYDYAVSKGIPVLAFDHADFTKLSANRTDQNDIKRNKLIAFKKKVSTGKLIKFWTNADDLALVVSTSLTRVLDLQPRIGWVRADKIISADSKNEIEKLNKEIEKYQNEVKKLEGILMKKDGDLEIINDKESNYQIIQQGNVIETSNNYKRIPDFWFKEYIVGLTIYFSYDCDNESDDDSFLDTAYYSLKDWFELIGRLILNNDKSIRRDDLEEDLAEMILAKAENYKRFKRNAKKVLQKKIASLFKSLFLIRNLEIDEIRIENVDIILNPLIHNNIIKVDIDNDLEDGFELEEGDQVLSLTKEGKAFLIKNCVVGSD